MKPEGRDPLRPDATGSPVEEEHGRRRGKTASGLTYRPAIDGLRALAVLAIIAFHLDYGWAKGGFLGVDLFFVVSGFLITTLLVVEWRGSGTIALARFWGRRVRRLLPALLLLLVGISVFIAAEVDPWNRVGVRNDGLASLFYVANWRFIAAGESYFTLFAAPSPLRHMWSLAIEEQFYLVWPIVVLVFLRVSRGSLRWLAAACGVGVVLSVAVMALSYDPADPLRAYYATDARAHTILVGALLALLLSARDVGASGGRRLVALGAGSGVLVLLAWRFASGTDEAYYRGGSLLYAALSAGVLAAALLAEPVARVLGWGPLAWVGRLSYGLYLFHWPIIVWLVPNRAGMSGAPLNALRVVLTFAAAIASYYFLERPIRERRLPLAGALSRSIGVLRRLRSEDRVVRWLAIPATAVTLFALVASARSSSPPPSYLVGERPQGFGGFAWNLGDPLFCGEPSSEETADAAEAAERLGPPEVGGSARGLRVLLLGDSTACSLYPGLDAVGDTVGAIVEQGSVFGCGIASGHVTTTRGEQITPHSERCPEMVDLALSTSLREFAPDVVLWMSSWEKSDLVVGDRTLVSGTPEGDREMLRRMDQALARITADGAEVVVITVPAPAPNDAEGLDNTSNAVDDASYERLNRILRRFVAQHPDQTTLVDLAERVCPGGPPCSAEVNGRTLRPDGRHFTPEAAAIEARWLLPSIVAATRW